MLDFKPFVKLNDHRRPDGEIDWDALRRAKVANGERCTECGAAIIFPKGYPAKCDSCASIARDSGEVQHPSQVRCPACGHSWSPWDSDHYELFADGEHGLSCHECEHEFTIITYVSYSFKSPARLPEEDEPEEEDDEESDDEEAA